MKFAICQELFEGWPWDRQCGFIAETGYGGIEVAPFTLAATPGSLSSPQRDALRRTAEQNGLEIVGLHWLLARTSGLHLTSNDPAVRKATADYLVELAELCADLGGSLMVFGSPQQRQLVPGVSHEEGLEFAADVFRQTLPALAERGVTICMEPLTPQETNFVNTCASAADLMARVDDPHVRLHQDVKAMLSEPDSIPDLIHRYRELTAHFHVNDSNLLGPGMGATDFAPILGALRATRYDGWVSVEVFDYAPGCEHIARESIEYLRATLRRIEG